MSELVTTYRCADGTNFPVTWEDEADAQLTWRLNADHFPAPLRPLDVATWELSLSARERAFSEAGLQLRDLLRRIYFPQGFVYLRTPIFDDDGIDDLVRRYGGVAAVWEEHCRPRVEEACTKLQAADNDTPIVELIDTCFYAFFKTMVAADVIFSATRRLTNFLVEAFGPEAEALIGELTQGHTNSTMDASQALWEISQAASRSAQVRELILELDLSTALSAVAHVEGGAKFRSAFDDFLQSFGRRSEGWEAGSPTWREHPTLPLGIIRRMIIDETPSPAGALDDVARRRRELADELERRLSGSAKQAELRGLLAQASSYVPIREDRAHWQLIAFGSFRAALLRRGAKMAREGSIDEPEDILSLLPEEIEGQDEAILATLPSVVVERRRKWERWSLVEPPSESGVAGTVVTATAATPPDGEQGRDIRGIAASRGVVTGPAKVMSELAQGDKLLPGDILVCKTNSPPWTVLFGRAAAVVAETGGALAHTAITAREYAIPCVVGARGATDRIHDGMLITVNGTEGVVSLPA